MELPRFGEHMVAWQSSRLLHHALVVHGLTGSRARSAAGKGCTAFDETKDGVMRLGLRAKARRPNDTYTMVV